MHIPSIHVLKVKETVDVVDGYVGTGNPNNIENEEKNNNSRQGTVKFNPRPGGFLKRPFLEGEA